jgi:hypothetical protein
MWSCWFSFYDSSSGEWNLPVPCAPPLQLSQFLRFRKCLRARCVTSPNTQMNEKPFKGKQNKDLRFVTMHCVSFSRHIFVKMAYIVPSHPLFCQQENHPGSINRSLRRTGVQWVYVEFQEHLQFKQWHDQTGPTSMAKLNDRRYQSFGAWGDLFQIIYKKISCNRSVIRQVLKGF